MTKIRGGSDASARLAPYLELVAGLVERGMEPEQFQRLYSERYLADNTMWPDAEFLVLDKLFSEVDDFEADPHVRAEMTHALDANELYRRAAAALAKLRDLVDRKSQ